MAICPTSKQLVAFQAGKLVLEEFELIAEHLESCAACQTSLDNGSTASDLLVKELRCGPHEDVFVEESACQRAVAQVEALVSNGAITLDVSNDAADTADAPIGILLGKYRLLAEIGKGGMGKVYKATHTVLKKTVAVKVLSPHRLKNPDALARFHREREAAGRLDHLNIVRAFDADEADGQHFLVMELLAGDDLAKRVRTGGPLPVAEACDFVRQAALGLDCAHRNGLVHRDVKPSNLFLTSEDGRPVIKVLDLGLALLRGDGVLEADLTSAGQVMGTYDFIAPEQVEESHNVDGRADMYSLGCTFYFLLTGRAPFQGKSELKKLSAHQTEEPPPITQIRADVPSDVIAVVTKMMAKEPVKRFGSMRELADLLAGIKVPRPAGETVSHTPSHPVTLSHSHPATKWLKAGLLLLGCFLVAVLGTYSIIRITTPEGDFVIDTDDPDIKFSVSKGVVILHDKKRTYHVGAVPKANGEYELNVRDVDADLSFKMDKLTIKRGETLALKGWFERKGLEKRPVEGGYIQLAFHGSARFEHPEFRDRTLTGVVIEIDGLPECKFDAAGVAAQFTAGVDVPAAVLFTAGGRDGLGPIAKILPGSRALAGDITIGTEKFANWPVGTITPKIQEARTLGPSIGRVQVPADATSVTTGDLVLALPIILEKGGGVEYGFIPGKKVRLGFLFPTEGKELTRLQVLGRSVELNPKKKPPDKAEVGEIRAFHGHTNSANCVAFAPDGKSFLSGGAGEILLWDVDGPKEKLRFVDKLKPLDDPGLNRIRRVGFTKDGKQAVSGGEDQIVRLWDVDKGAVLKHLDIPKAKTPVTQFVGLSPDGKYLVVASDPGYVRLFVFPELAESSLRFGGTQASFSRDGDKLLTLDRNYVELNHLSPPKRTFVMQNDITCISLTPDGRYAVIGGLDATIYVWDMVDKKQIHKMTGHKGTIQALAISPDGKRALSGGGDATVRLWDLTIGKEIRSFEGHTAPVVGVAFSPDGQRALSAGGTDKSIRLWQLPKP